MSAVPKLMEALSRSGTGAEYFRALVRELASSLDMDYAFIAEVISEEPLRGRMLAVYADGNVVPNWEFRIGNTPCRELFESSYCCYPVGVRTCFPDDTLFVKWEAESYAGVRLLDESGALLGWMTVMSRKPMIDTGLIRSAMQFVSHRTSAELRRERHEQMRERELRESRDRYERTIHHLVFDATHDHLTSLPNRAVFLDRVEHAIAINRRDRIYDFAVLFLDLDRFKVVNDSLGHLAGDELLCEFANRVRRCLQPSDMLARLGGDEFTILLENIAGPADATTVAERVLAALSQPFRVAGLEVYTSASIGIAVSAKDYAHADDLVRDADTAMSLL